MKNFIPSTSKFLTCLLALCVGVIVVSISWGYELGNLRRIGPGAFPLTLGVILLVLALLVLIEPASEEVQALPDLRAVVAISLAFLVFAIGLPRFGLMPATAISVVISALASPNSRLWEVIGLALIVPLAFAVIFVLGLSMPVSLFDW